MNIYFAHHCANNATISFQDSKKKKRIPLKSSSLWIQADIIHSANKSSKLKKNYSLYASMQYIVYLLYRLLTSILVGSSISLRYMKGSVCMNPLIHYCGWKKNIVTLSENGIIQKRYLCNVSSPCKLRLDYHDMIHRVLVIPVFW